MAKLQQPKRTIPVTTLATELGYNPGRRDGARLGAYIKRQGLIAVKKPLEVNGKTLMINYYVDCPLLRYKVHRYFQRSTPRP